MMPFGPVYLSLFPAPAVTEILIYLCPPCTLILLPLSKDAAAMNVCHSRTQ